MKRLNQNSSQQIHVKSQVKDLELLMDFPEMLLGFIGFCGCFDEN